MYESVKSFLSKDFVESRDENLLRELRDYAEAELDAIKQERADACRKELIPLYTFFVAGRSQRLASQYLRRMTLLSST